MWAGNQSDPEKLILVTVLYNEANKDRCNEYLKCMMYNLNHAMISKIHVVYDTSKDNQTTKHPILDYLIKNNVEIDYVSGRPTYGYCFSLANKLYPHRKIIVSNADIYFNETLFLLKSYDLTNKFLALTRWQENADKSLKFYNSRWSQDTWIFRTPIKKINVDNIKIGVPACEHNLVNAVRKAGLTVINPCLSIQCCHVHRTGLRHYDNGRYNIPSGYQPPFFTRLT